MRTVSLFKNKNNQAIRLPKDMAYQGVDRLEIIRKGDIVILRPLRPSWTTFNDLPKADSDFLQDRKNVIAFESDNFIL